MILEIVFGYSTHFGSDIISTCVCMLRRHLAYIGLAGAVETVRGIGYRVSHAAWRMCF